MLTLTKSETDDEDKQNEDKNFILHLKRRALYAAYIRNV